MDLGLTQVRPQMHRLGWRLPHPALVLTLAACALFLFVDLRPLPIQLWDESRIAVNALEMHLRGPSLITTYDFVPDLWNTKPPLLIWLIDAAMAVVGPSELAVRLPSYLAVVGTLVLAMGFVRRATGSPWPAAAAALLLSTSLGYYEHGARTGDYDALLTFFTTAYLIRLYRAVHRVRATAVDLLATGALIAAALLTKSVAGLVPGVGFGLYLLICNRWRRPLESPWYALAVLAALTTGATFYLAREAAAPGFLAAVWGNDISGRFATALDQHAGPPWYYLSALGNALFPALVPLALLAPLALRGAPGKARQALVFSLSVAAGTLAVISLSSTKLPQYAIPALPFLAIAAAIAGHGTVRRIEAGGLKPASPLAARAVLAAVLAAVVGVGVQIRYTFIAERGFLNQALYGELLGRLAAGGRNQVGIVDPGVSAIGVPKGYAPQLRFYALLWAPRGLEVQSIPDAAAGRQPVVASCHPSLLQPLAALGPDIGGVPGCRAVVRR